MSSLLHGLQAAATSRRGEPEEALVRELQRSLVYAYANIEGAKPTKAIPFFQKVCALFTELEYEVGRIYYEHSHLDDATARFKHIAEHQPDHRLATVAARLLVDSYVQQGDFESLDRQVGVLLELYPAERDRELHALLSRLRRGSASGGE